MIKLREICVCVGLTIGLSCLGQQYYFSSGYGFSLSLCNNQKVESWGDNSYGQLARNTQINSSNQPNHIPYLENIISIDAGLGSFACALTQDGYVLSWGQNFYGELGIGKTFTELNQQAVPDTVLGGETGTKYLENVVAISLGQSHAYALLSTGEMVAWGNNLYGQLGDGTTENKTTPVYVKSSNSEHFTDIIHISAGGAHGYLITSKNMVYAWGNNESNQLGCGDSEIHYFPQNVVDKNMTPIQDISQIAGGMSFGLMLRVDGKVYGTGAYKGTNNDKSGIHYKTNTYAELLLGGETLNYYLENVIEISAGFSHAMAITKEKGKNYVVSWGDNLFYDLFQSTGGQLGIGNIVATQSQTPVYMKSDANTKVMNAIHIKAGCGVSIIQNYDNETFENQLLICGSNTYGQLGLGDNSDRFFFKKLTTQCPIFDTTYYGPTFEVSGFVVTSLNTPIVNCQVYLYKDGSDSPTDSCKTDLQGNFMFKTRKCTGCILVKSPTENHFDTWAGDKTKKEDAYKFTIDASIKHITITLQTQECSILILPDMIQQAQTITIISTDGKIMQIIPSNQFNKEILSKYRSPILLKIDYGRHSEIVFLKDL